MYDIHGNCYLLFVVNQRGSKMNVERSYKTILVKGVGWHQPSQKEAVKAPKSRLNLPSHLDLFEEARLSIQAMKDRKAQRRQNEH